MLLLAATIAPLPMAVALVNPLTETSAPFPNAVKFDPVKFV